MGKERMGKERMSKGGMGNDGVGGERMETDGMVYCFRVQPIPTMCAAAVQLHVHLLVPAALALDAIEQQRRHHLPRLARPPHRPLRHHDPRAGCKRIPTCRVAGA